MALAAAAAEPAPGPLPARRPLARLEQPDQAPQAHWGLTAEQVQ